MNKDRDTLAKEMESKTDKELSEIMLSQKGKLWADRGNDYKGNHAYGAAHDEMRNRQFWAAQQKGKQS